MQRAWFVVVAVALSMVAPPLNAQERDSAISFGIDAYWDSGTHKRRDFNVGDTDAGRSEQEFSSDKLFAVSLGYLTHLSERVRFGGALRYFGAYAFTPENRPDNPEALGTLVELAAQLEYVLPIIDEIDVLLGGQLGLAVLFPGGVLSDRIDDSRPDFNTWRVPRLGYVFGPQAGIRYKFSEWLALRTDVSVLWQQLFLMNASASAGDIRSEQSWRANMTRLRVGLSLEFLF